MHFALGCVGKEEMELAYAAGLFDGEGCVQIVGPPERLEFRLTVGNTYRPVLEALSAQFGGSVLLNSTGQRPVYVWKIGAARAVTFATAILPFSRVKRDQLGFFINARSSLRKASAAQPLTPDDLRSRQQAIDTLKAFRSPM